MPHIYPTHAHTTFKRHRIAVQLESAQAHRANLSRLFDRRCRINCTDSILMTDTGFGAVEFDQTCFNKLVADL
jgi:hypothetical protein